MVDTLKKGWFSEVDEKLWPGQCFSLEYEQVLHHARSDFQDILVLKTKTYGNVLVLDNKIQITERDEFSYQEMLAHLPLFSHPNPKKVLIVGGGDGGILREVLKHKSVEHVTMCEIDGEVVRLSKQYLPSISCAFDDPRANLYVGDGLEFMRKHTNEFDVIITDSSDPIGPAASLFEKQYYEEMKSSLREGGVLATQGECQWLHLDLIKEMNKFCRTLFPQVAYAFTTIPTYPSGQIGFVLCSKNPDTKFGQPCRVLSEEEADTMKLRYYDSDVHRAAFVLPRFARKALEDQ